MTLKKLLTQSIIWRGFYFFSLLFVNIFLSRYLQAAGTGNLYFITVIFSFTQVILSLGGESGVTYFAAGNIIERNKLIHLTGVWSFVAGILMMALVYLYFLFDTSADKNMLYWYCVFGFLYVCGLSLTNYSIAIYYSRGNYFLPNFLFAIVNFIYVIIIPGKDVHTNPTQVHWITLLYFATFFIAGLLIYFSYVLQYRKEGASGFPERSYFIQLFRYSITALAANVIFFLVYKIDYLFVNYSPVCSKADLGNYIQVSKLGQLMFTVPQIIASVVFPRSASGVDEQTLSRNIITMARIFSQAFLLVFIVIALTGKELFTAIFGESFSEMQLPMLILIPGIFALSVLALLSAYFAGKGKIKVNLYAAIIGLIVMVTGDLIFVPRYGIIAAAAVSTVSYAANVVYSMWNFYKDYSIHWIEFFKWEKADYNWLFSILKFNKPLQ
jgi:O-antigen/teichoic acid export membrane protein